MDTPVEPAPFEEIRPERPRARRTVKFRTPSGYDVSATAAAIPIPDSLNYGPFELIGDVAINSGSMMRVSCAALEIDELIRILRSLQAVSRD